MSTDTPATTSPANRSPWLEQVPRRRPVCMLDHDLETDVAIVGGGIAGVATAFFLLRDTNLRVTILEAFRVAHGATGYNAGQLVTYFERPICRLAEDFGYEKALRGQRDVDAAWGLFDVMVGEAEFPLEVPRIVGHLGMFSLNHLMVHLRNNQLRKRGGLVRELIRVSARAEFLRDIPKEYDGLYEVVPQAKIQALLETDDDRYRATLSGVKGCANSAALSEHLVCHMAEAFGDRFELYEDSPVASAALGRQNAQLRAVNHKIRAARVVLCTNGFTDLDIENAAGGDIEMPALVQGTVGFMAAYLEPDRHKVRATSYLVSPRINEGQAYFYVTRRPYERDGGPSTLTCIGGPDRTLAPAEKYDRSAPFPSVELADLNRHIAPIMGWTDGAAPTYDYVWHGLMGYTSNQVRAIGPDRRNEILLYNLGCNGVGLLPSIHGAWRITQILSGVAVAPSMFDPA